MARHRAQPVRVHRCRGNKRLSGRVNDRLPDVFAPADTTRANFNAYLLVSVISLEIVLIGWLLAVMLTFASTTSDDESELILALSVGFIFVALLTVNALRKQRPSDPIGWMPWLCCLPAVAFIAYPGLF